MWKKIVELFEQNLGHIAVVSGLLASVLGAALGPVTFYVRGSPVVIPHVPWSEVLKMAWHGAIGSAIWHRIANPKIVVAPQSIPPAT